MALIKNIKRIHKIRGSVHKPVDCTYFTFNNFNGDKYLIIDTYGSKDRQIKNKVSQTIQLNKESAKQLFKIIKEEFDFN